MNLKLLLPMVNLDRCRRRSVLLIVVDKAVAIDNRVFSAILLGKFIKRVEASYDSIIFHPQLSSFFSFRPLPWPSSCYPFTSGSSDKKRRAHWSSGQHWLPWHPSFQRVRSSVTVCYSMLCKKISNAKRINESSCLSAKRLWYWVYFKHLGVLVT